MFKISVPVFVLSVLIYACSGSESKALPPSPASVQAVKDQLKGKNFKAEKAGTHFFSTDKEVVWMDPKPEEKFEKEIADDSKTLEIKFTNDTAVTVMYKGKSYVGTYAVDNEAAEDESPGIKLRTSYVDEEFKFGDGPASKVTYTYLVEGINDESVLLLTPRSMNNKKIVVLMNKQ